ncbi:hypothetical protein BH20VER1_BH20VER1_28650 [soil metagenome]
MKHLLLSVVLGATLVCSSAFAQSKIELLPNDTMKTVLERNVGQVVELRLKSGEKMGGKVEKISDGLAHLAQLTGAEYYDAVVDINEVAAVSIRTKK